MGASLSEWRLLCSSRTFPVQSYDIPFSTRAFEIAHQKWIQITFNAELYAVIEFTFSRCWWYLKHCVYSSGGT